MQKYAERLEGCADNPRALSVLALWLQAFGKNLGLSGDSHVSKNRIVATRDHRYRLRFYSLEWQNRNQLSDMSPKFQLTSLLVNNFMTKPGDILMPAYSQGLASKLLQLISGQGRRG